MPWIQYPATFAHVLLNMGYRNEWQLLSLVEAWQNLFQLIQPDMAVFDHCPTGLLASRGAAFPRFTIGHGFYTPIDTQPLSSLAPCRDMPLGQRMNDEQEVTDRLNRVLKANRQPALSQLGALFSEVDCNLLTTYEELDHNINRASPAYYGTWSLSPKANVTSGLAWPEGEGTRVFAYLKPMNGLREMIALLSHRNVPTIAVLDNATRGKLKEVAGPNVQLTDRPVRLSQLVSDCGLAITNAGHATICELLKAAIPQAMIPLTLEQAILSERVASINAGIKISSADRQEMLNQLNSILVKPDQFAGATLFARSHSADDEANIENCFARLND
ncbi:MAG: hypothetical protein ABJZ55_05005 [Fuerstiella sp.]